MPHPMRFAGQSRQLSLAVLGAALLLISPLLARAQDAALYPGAPALTSVADVLLRGEPDYDGSVVTALGVGTPLTVIDGPYTADDGTAWYQVDLGGAVGYAPADALTSSAVAADPAASGEAVAESAATESTWVDPDPVDAAVVDPAMATGDVASESTAAPVAAYEPAPATLGPGTTTSDVNLRAAPDGNSAVLATLPPGTALEVTGEVSDGYFPVLANGTGGWVAAEYIQAGTAAPAELAAAPAAPAEEAAAESAAPVSAALPAEGSLSLVADANLRAEPYPEATIIGSVPGGAPVSASGVAENGYTPVLYNGQFGWVPTETVAGGATAPAAAPGVDTTAAQPPVAGAIQWPFGGGTWEVIQGYNNGTHQNRSSFANYQYALDWARADGETAGSSIAAPASGTIGWTDPGSGGILIDMGNGYGVAMFHLTVDGSLRKGQSISAGQHIGVISGPGGPGYMSVAHVDLTLWQLVDGGSHIATPFDGQFAIGGTSFPASGAGNQHMGEQITLP